MYRVVSKSVAMVLALAMGFSCVLSGCGGQRSASDAQKYVQAVLDMICTGEYDTSVKFSDIEDAEQAREMILAGAESSMDNLEEALGVTFNSDVRASFRNAIAAILKQARYTVGDAVKSGDGYDVTVTIEPLDLTEMQADLTEDISEELSADEDFLALPEEEMINTLFVRIFDAMADRMTEVEYGDPVEVTVHYGLLDENAYGLDEADGQRLGEALFAS